MRILVISDTHGINKEIIETILKDKKADMMIHLGDYVKDGEKISKILGLPSVIVKGNGDYDSDYPEDRLVDIEDKKIFLTHGHKYNIKSNIDNIYYKAMELGADIALFGHSHIALNIKEGDIIIMNPGSPSLPRDINRTRSYGIIEIGEKIKTEIVKIQL